MPRVVSTELPCTQHLSKRTPRLCDLLKDGADVNLRGYLGQNLLYSASIEGFPDVMRWLLDRGVDITVQRCEQSTALHLAAFAGRLEVAEILLERNADVNACDYQAWDRLDDEARCRHLELV